MWMDLKRIHFLKNLHLFCGSAKFRLFVSDSGCCCSLSKVIVTQFFLKIQFKLEILLRTTLHIHHCIWMKTETINTTARQSNICINHSGNSYCKVWFSCCSLWWYAVHSQLNLISVNQYHQRFPQIWFRFNFHSNTDSSKHCFGTFLESIFVRRKF